MSTKAFKQHSKWVLFVSSLSFFFKYQKKYIPCIGLSTYMFSVKFHKKTNKSPSDTLWSIFDSRKKRDFKENLKFWKKQPRKPKKNETKQPRNDKIKTKIGYRQYNVKRMSECACVFMYMKRAVQFNIEMIWKMEKERKKEGEKRSKEQSECERSEKDKKKLTITIQQAYQKGLTIFMTRILIFSYSAWFVCSICHALLALIRFSILVIHLYNVIWSK